MKSVMFLSSVVVMGGMAASAFANPLLPQKVRTQIEAKKPALAASEECTDFSGSWVGTCIDSDGETYESTWEVKQEEYSRCTEIQLGETYMEIGGSWGETHVSGQASSQRNFQAYPDWNSGKTELLIRYHFLGRELNQRNFYRINGQLKLKLIGDQLETFAEYSAEFENDGSTTKFKGWDECTYSRATR